MLSFLIIVGCQQDNNSYNEGSAITTEENQDQISGTDTTSTTGSFIFAITDAAENLDHVTNVEITINSIEIHHPARGWITIDSQEQTFDLLQLKNEDIVALLAQKELEEGIYDQIRLEISDVRVTEDSGEVQQAVLPSGELKIKNDFVVKEGEISVVTLDFIADDSLHRTGKGEFIMAPVINVEAREQATVEIDNGRIEIKGGEVRVDSTFGMDEHGNMGINVRIPPGTTLSINQEVPGGRIEVIADTTAGASGSTSVRAESNDGGRVSVSASTKSTSKDGENIVESDLEINRS